jgi:hypothetical protein
MLSAPRTPLAQIVSEKYTHSGKWHYATIHGTSAEKFRDIPGCPQGRPGKSPPTRGSLDTLTLRIRRT